MNAKWRAEFATESEADVRTCILAPFIMVLYRVIWYSIKTDIHIFCEQVKADRGEIETDDLAFQAIEEWTKHLPNRENPVNKIPCE